MTPAGKLRRQLKLSREAVGLHVQTISRMEGRIESLQHQVHLALEKVRAAQATRDTSMIDARVKLASQLGQMMEAFTRAIGFIIAKEQL